MKPTRSLTVLALACFALAGAPAQAELSPLSLDNAGRVLRIQTGAYGDLFSGGNAALPGSTVVALEVQWATHQPILILVPGTETEAEESEARIFWDSGAESAILMWLSGAADAPKTLDFKTVRQTDQGVEWSETHQLLSGDEPQLFDAWPSHLVTQDEHRVVPEEGEPTITRRTLVHLIWQGPAAEATTTFYSALTFVDGDFGAAPVRLDLGNTFLQAPEGVGDTPPPLPTGLAQTTRIRHGKGPGSVLVALANPTTQRLGTLEIDIMPLQISTLGDLVRDEAYAAADAYDPGDIQVFADEMKAGIVIIGYHLRLHPAVTDYLADEIEHWLQEEGSSYGYESFPDLGNDARELSLQLTRSVYASTIEDPFDPDSTTIEIGLGDFLDDLESGGPAQRIGVREVANLEAPAVAGSETWLFTSADGFEILVAWQSEEEPDALYYVENRGGSSWSEPRLLQLSERLSVEQAHALLENRLP